MNNLVFTLIERGLGWNLFRSAMMQLDRAAYAVFGWIMQGIFDIACSYLLTEDAYAKFAQRVYIIIGVYMLFKMTVTMLEYLVNPDKLTDKTEGFSKFIGRTLTALCMLVGLPIVWNLVMSPEVTKTLLEATPRIIIGKNSRLSDTGSNMNQIANEITWTTYSLVFHMNSANDNDFQAVNDVNNIKAATEVVNDPVPGDRSEYLYEYIPIIGSLIAVVMIFILAGIAIDIAIRAFKLMILRMIAPIPIISYIAPKSSKPNGMFNNWVKTLVSTFADLYIKIGTLYFVLYMIDTIVFQEEFELAAGATGTRKMIVIIFLIIGLFFFAKKAPKFICDILGIKSSEGLGGFGGALAAGLAGGAVGGLAAGAGALVGGAGLAGALGAGVSAAGENFNAGIHGKSGTAGWSKGSDLAAQLRTGDKNAKGGWAAALSRRAQDAAANRRANSLGLSADNVEQLKQNMYASQDKVTEAQDKLQEYQMGIDSGKYKYDANTVKALQDNIRLASYNANKAQSYYNDAKAGRESIMPANRTVDNYTAGGTYRSHLNAGSKDFERKPTSTRDFTPKDLNSVELPLNDESSGGAPASSGNAPASSGSAPSSSVGPSAPYSPDEWADIVDDVMDQNNDPNNRM